MGGYSDMAVQTAQAKAAASGTEEDKKIAEEAKKNWGSNTPKTMAEETTQAKNAAELSSLSDEDLVSKRNGATGDERKKYQDEINKRDKDGKHHFWQAKPETKKEEPKPEEKVDKEEPKPEVDTSDGGMTDDEAGKIKNGLGIEDEDDAEDTLANAGIQVEKDDEGNIIGLIPGDLTRSAFAKKYGAGDGQWQKIATFVSVALSVLTGGGIPPINFTMLDFDKKGYDEWLKQMNTEFSNRSASTSEATFERDKADIDNNAKGTLDEDAKNKLERKAMEQAQDMMFRLEELAKKGEIDAKNIELIQDVIRSGKVEDLNTMREQLDDDTFKLISKLADSKSGVNSVGSQEVTDYVYKGLDGLTGLIPLAGKSDKGVKTFISGKQDILGDMF